MAHYDITIGNDIPKDVHCDIIIGHEVVMGTYHDITTHTDIAKTIIYYVTVHNYNISVILIKSLTLYIKHLYHQNRSSTA